MKLWVFHILQVLHLCTSLYRHCHWSIDRNIAALLLGHMEALLDLGEGRSGGRAAGGAMVGEQEHRLKEHNGRGAGAVVVE